MDLPRLKEPPHGGSVQQGELRTLSLALDQLQKEPLNVFSDSIYVVQVSKDIAQSSFRVQE